MQCYMNLHNAEAAVRCLAQEHVNIHKLGSNPRPFCQKMTDSASKLMCEVMAGL